MRVLRYLSSPLGPSCSGDTPPSCPSRALCPCPCACAVKPKEAAQSFLWAPQWRRTFLLASAPGVRSLFYYLCFCVRSAPLLVARGLSSGGQMLPHSISSSPRILISSHSIFFPVSLPFSPPSVSFPFIPFHSTPLPHPFAMSMFCISSRTSIIYMVGGTTVVIRYLFSLLFFALPLCFCFFLGSAPSVQ